MERIVRLGKWICKSLFMIYRALLGDTPNGLEGVAHKLGFFESLPMAHTRYKLVQAHRRQDAAGVEHWRKEYLERAQSWAVLDTARARARFEIAVPIQMAHIYRTAGDNERARRELIHAQAAARVRGLERVAVDIDNALLTLAS